MGKYPYFVFWLNLDLSTVLFRTTYHINDVIGCSKVTIFQKNYLTLNSCRTGWKRYGCFFILPQNSKYFLNISVYIYQLVLPCKDKQTKNQLLEKIFLISKFCFCPNQTDWTHIYDAQLTYLEQKWCLMSVLFWQVLCRFWVKILTGISNASCIMQPCLYIHISLELRVSQPEFQRLLIVNVYRWWTSCFWILELYNSQMHTCPKTQSHVFDELGRSRGM